MEMVYTRIVINILYSAMASPPKEFSNGVISAVLIVVSIIAVLEAIAIGLLIGAH